MITTVGLFCIVLSFMHFSSASPIRREEPLTVIKELKDMDFFKHNSDLYYTPEVDGLNEEDNALSCFMDQLRVLKSSSKDRTINNSIDSVLESLLHETNSTCSIRENEKKQAPIAFLEQLENLLQKRYERYSDK